MPTRSKSRKQAETLEGVEAPEAREEVEAPPIALAQQIEPVTTGIMRNANLLAELNKQRDEIAILSQRLAASEERAYNLTATLKWLQEQQKQDVLHLEQVVATERQRLTEVERHGRRLFKTMRNQLREEHSGERTHVETQQKPAGVHVVQRDVEDDSQSTVSSLSRAEVMMQSLENARSEVGSTVSRGRAAVLVIARREGIALRPRPELALRPHSEQGHTEEKARGPTGSELLSAQ